MPLTDSLVSYFKLDEASGNATDAAGANTLTDNNSVGTAAGKINSARHFTAASSQYLSCTAAGLASGNFDYTVTAWVYLDSKASELTFVTTQYPGAILRYNNSTDRFEFFYGANFKAVGDALGSPSTGTWYFLIGWYDATADKIRLQINDGTVDEADDAAPSASGSSFSIGARGGGNFHDGRADEVGVWTRVFTSGERTSLYNAGAGLPYPFTTGSAGAPYYYRHLAGHTGGRF